jgi:hypothetical protein
MFTKNGKSGFSRAQVDLLSYKTGTDTHLSWLGSQIADKLVNGLCEAAESLKKLRAGCKTDKWLVVTGGARVWHGEVKTDGKDTYVRDCGDGRVLVGSVSQLRSAYGKAVLFGSRAEAEKSFSGLKSYNAIVKAEVVKAKTVAKAKGTTKALVMTGKAKTSGKAVKVVKGVKVAKLTDKAKAKK